MLPPFRSAAAHGRGDLSAQTRRYLLRNRPQRDLEAAMTDTDQPVLVEARDHKLYITLNRPEALNAQNQPLREALVVAIERLEGDPDLLVGIICGAGGRAFSAGADLKEVRSASESRRPVPEQHRRQ